MTSADWATVASLATALGTLVLAVATFSAVRTGNRTARAAELSLLTSPRPLLTPSRREDSALKVNFGDNKWLRVPGSSAVGEIGGGDGTAQGISWHSPQVLTKFLSPGTNLAVDVTHRCTISFVVTRRRSGIERGTAEP